MLFGNYCLIAVFFLVATNKNFDGEFLTLEEFGGDKTMFIAELLRAAEHHG